MCRISMVNPIEPFRYELIHGDDADFIAYQAQVGRRCLANSLGLDDSSDRLPLESNDTCGIKDLSDHTINHFRAGESRRHLHVIGANV
jgi:hypothetical protein